MINILTTLGNLQRRRGDHEKSRQSFEKALDLENNNVYALYGLGHYYRWQGNYPVAISLWEQVLERSEGNVDLLARLGDAYRNIGNLVAAESNYRKALDKGYDKFSLLGLAKVHAIRGEVNEMEGCYRQLMANEQENGRFFGEITSQLIEHRQQSDAASFYRTACELHQDNQDVFQKLANRAEELGLTSSHT
jgi:tetratricopeptide (TPR) repeat protein